MIDTLFQDMVRSAEAHVLDRARKTASEIEASLALPEVADCIRITAGDLLRNGYEPTDIARHLRTIADELHALQYARNTASRLTELEAKFKGD